MPSKQMLAPVSAASSICLPAQVGLIWILHLATPSPHTAMLACCLLLFFNAHLHVDHDVLSAIL